MFHTLIHFSTLAGQLAQEHAPEEAMNPFHFGLSPAGVVAVVLLLICVVWVAMQVQAGRADLHAATEHGSEHNGHGEGHGH